MPEPLKTVDWIVATAPVHPTIVNDRENDAWNRAIDIVNCWKYRFLYNSADPPSPDDNR